MPTSSASNPMSTDPAPLSTSQEAVLIKYKIGNEKTWQDVARRVAKHVASVEAPEDRDHWEQAFYEIIEPMLFVPAGSILANAGYGTGGLMNCFALSSEDNIQDITKLLSDSLLTTKFRGGIGINIGSEGQIGYIRPKGSPFKDGCALGPLAVLDMVSDNCKKLTTGNKARRGAFLFSMHWKHPDINEFIDTKKQSTIDADVAKAAIEGTITPEQFKAAWQETHLDPDGKRERRWHNANISVQLDDEFFEKLSAGDETVTRLWQKIAENAHATADPGILFIDEAKRRSPIRDFITVTNPCVTADTWVHTGSGPLQVKDLVGRCHTTYVNGDLFPTTDLGFWSTGTKPIYKLKTKEGYSLKLTGNHKLLRCTATSTDWVEAEFLQPGDKIRIHNHRGILPWLGSGTKGEGLSLGCALGGNTSLIMGGDFKIIAYAFSELTEEVKKTTGKKVPIKSELVSRTCLLLLNMQYGLKKSGPEITPQIEASSYEFYTGFLQGLFEAIATPCEKEKQVRITILRRKSLFLRGIQRMLLRLGICSKISGNLDRTANLEISGSNAEYFARIIGFHEEPKKALLAELLSIYPPITLEDFTATVSAVKPAGSEEVFDCSVPDVNRFDANGLVAHNCGEVFLPPNSSCNLGSLVIPRFLDSYNNLDTQKLKKVTEVAVRFLDDVIDASQFATEEQRHNIQDLYRQLGLGVMGWADYLKTARIPYDSQEHLKEISKIGELIANSAYRASEQLAELKGPCGIWPKIADIKTENPFESWTGSFEKHTMTQTPRRNSTVLSVAPTGSIAQLAACSWAFEPDFGLSTWKQVFVDASVGTQNWVQILNPHLESLNLSEEDTQIVLSTGSLEGTTYQKAFPGDAACFKIAREITPHWHILVQAEWQKWLDSSVSKTINLPTETTPEEIADIYLFAKENGLKGITVYRSGTLESEPIKVGSNETATLELPSGNEVESKTYENGCKDGSCNL